MSRRPTQRDRLGVQRTSMSGVIDLRRLNFRWRVLRHQHLTVPERPANPSERRMCLGREWQKPCGQSARVAVATCASWRCRSSARLVSTSTCVVPCLARRFTLVHVPLPCLVPLGRGSTGITGVTLRPHSGGSKAGWNHHVYISICACSRTDTSADPAPGTDRMTNTRAVREMLEMPQCSNVRQDVDVVSVRRSTFCVRAGLRLTPRLIPGVQGLHASFSF